MDANQGPSTSVGEEFDGDTKPLVGRDRGPLSRQAPVELEARGASPTSPGSANGQAAGEGGDICGSSTNAVPESAEQSNIRNRRSGYVDPA